MGFSRRGHIFCTVSEGKHVRGGFDVDRRTEGELQPGKRLSRQYVYGLVKRLAAKAKEENLIADHKSITPHSLRHTFGTMVAAREPEGVVEAALRHTTPDMSRHYVHIAQSRVREAVDRLPTLTDEAPEAEPEPDTEAQDLAAKIAAMTPERRAALRELLG